MSENILQVTEAQQVSQMSVVLSHTLGLNNTPHSPARYVRVNQFKARCLPNQETRRKKALLEQKQRREEVVSRARRLISVSLEEEDEGEVAGQTPFLDAQSTQCPPLRTTRQELRGQLMEYEVMVDVPEDLQQQWMMLLIPQGIRCLVISHKGKTTAWNKMGELVDSFQSSLPGGSHRDNRRRNYCILDAIVDLKTRQLYVVDMMCWNNNPVYDCESEFRMYWKYAKLSEVNVFQCHPHNKYAFVMLDAYDCNPQTILQIMSKQMPFVVDQCLFLYKESHYDLGSSNPLACWLKPFPSDHFNSILGDYLARTTTMDTSH